MKILILFFAVSLSFFLGGCSSKKRETNVCFSRNCFKVEVAQTKAQREKGLMFRESLEQDRGMLFVFEKENIYPFYMKNTLVPLDIIWINADKRIIHISKNTPPCITKECPNIEPDGKARFVLEVNAGVSDKIGIAVGDELTFEE